LEVELPEKSPSIQIGALRESELAEARRIVCLAFGTFMGMANPLEFMGDRDFVAPRWRARNTQVLAARENGKLIGINVATRWGSFAFFGPLTIVPDYWNRGVAQRLLAATMKVFDKWGVIRSGLYTFPHSAKHIGLYQKFGYWPGHLTALMRSVPRSRVAPVTKNAKPVVLLSALSRGEREKAIRACAKLAGGILKGLDLSEEIAAVLKQRIGEVILVEGRNSLDAFAVCMHGPGSEGGAKTIYVKFAAARGGPGGGDRFTRLLEAIESWALERSAEVEAGVSLNCVDAFRRMQANGYQAFTQGVAMQQPHGEGYNSRGAYVINDWR
jgi:GNAT superfamily N-acetyltransferase